MKNLIFLLLSSIFLESCGTTGHVQFYNFDTRKDEVEKELRFIIHERSGHSIPAKWSDIYKDPGPIEYIYVYFSKLPEEMYQVGFTGDSNEWKTSVKCQLGLVGLFRGDHWEYRKELSYKEIERMKKRFEREILSKIRYAYYTE